jgi:hypothetical protein
MGKQLDYQLHPKDTNASNDIHVIECCRMSTRYADMPLLIDRRYVQLVSAKCTYLPKFRPPGYISPTVDAYAVVGIRQSGNKVLVSASDTMQFRVGSNIRAHIELCSDSLP